MKEIYRVDIIVPVYNSKNFIQDTLESIIRQSYKNWRILLIDDNSNDGTSEIIKNFINNNVNKKKFIFIKNKKNKGQSCTKVL